MRSQPDAYALLVADVFHTAGEMRRAGEAIAGRVGQTQARWQVMSVISEGTWTVPDTARRLGITRQGVQRIADELVKDGLAAYAENPRHRRSAFLRLTTKGSAALTKITAIAQRHNQKVMALFSTDELMRTRDVLRRIVAALETV